MLYTRISVGWNRTCWLYGLQFLFAAWLAWLCTVYAHLGHHCPICPDNVLHRANFLQLRNEGFAMFFLPGSSKTVLLDLSLENHESLAVLAVHGLRMPTNVQLVQQAMAPAAYI